MKTEYLFSPSKFPAPQVKVLHISSVIDIKDDAITVSAETKFLATDTLDNLKLNAKNLEIILIMQNGRVLSYTYENDIITIDLPRTVQKGTEFRIVTKTVCHPTENILEGFYYDIEPAEQPRTIITQCQQWGFQRIMPCIDDMRAKCTWTTTIIADNRYTNLITNGNVSRPRTRYDTKRDTITYENSEPMPPYLFFLGVGTWETVSSDFIYPDGRVVRLELLALPNDNAKSEDKDMALDIMADAILWTHIFTGPERFQDLDKKHELYKLCTERFNLVKKFSNDLISEEQSQAKSANSSKEIQELTKRIEELYSNMVCGYQYPYEVYREIAMENSDFGGMENTGNTTIIASRIMPDSEITDAAYEYMLGVKQHEFYHNLNGSGVTGDTPFSIWLNEAVTVMMEDEYLAFHFGRDYVRLLNVLQLYTPGTGTFSLDTSAISMPIEPDGFNDPNDLITAVTYVKAPEFTRMIETMLGKEAFTWALDLYHKRFMGGNASPRDWLHAMEDVGKSDFSFMADRWLKQTGYPTVTATAVHHPESRTAEITVTQKGFGSQKPWIFPFKGILVNKDGHEVSSFMKKIDAEKLTFSVYCREEFAFAIWNENHAAYIKMERQESDEVLYLQTQYDVNPVSRYLAFLALYEREMVKLLEDETATPSFAFVNEVMRTLGDEKLMKSCGALPLTMFESVSDARFAHAYTKLYSAKQKILLSIAQNHKSELESLYEKYSLANISSVIEMTAFDPAALSCRFKANAVKNFVLTVLASLDTEEIHEKIYRQYLDADCATVRLRALSLYLSSSASDRKELLAKELERSASHKIAFENAISAASQSTSEDTVSYLEMILKLPSFRIEQAGHARALYLRFAENRKVSLESARGRQFLKESIIRLAPVNAYITTGMLSVFSHMQSYDENVRSELMAMLKDIEVAVEESGAVAVLQTIRQILAAVE